MKLLPCRVGRPALLQLLQTPSNPLVAERIPSSPDVHKRGIHSGRGVDCKGFWEQGAKAEGRVPVDALVQLSCTFASAVAGEAAGARGRYASFEDARSGASEVGGAAARAAVDDYASAVRLQAMTDSVRPPGASAGPTQPAAVHYGACIFM